MNALFVSRIWHEIEAEAAKTGKAIWRAPDGYYAVADAHEFEGTAAPNDWTEVEGVTFSDLERVKAGAVDVRCIECGEPVDPQETWQAIPEEAVVCSECATGGVEREEL